MISHMQCTKNAAWTFLGPNKWELSVTVLTFSTRDSSDICVKPALTLGPAYKHRSLWDARSINTRHVFSVHCFSRGWPQEGWRRALSAL